MGLPSTILPLHCNCPQMWNISEQELGDFRRAQPLVRFCRVLAVAARAALTYVCR
jgi:hypothetical protein